MLAIIYRKISPLQPFLKKAVKHGKDGDFRQLQGKNSDAPKGRSSNLNKAADKKLRFSAKTLMLPASG